MQINSSNFAILSRLIRKFVKKQATRNTQYVQTNTDTRPLINLIVLYNFAIFFCDKYVCKFRPNQTETDIAFIMVKLATYIHFQIAVSSVMSPLCIAI